ncbi:MAG: hypothetical protein V1495_01060 [Pseudomonadota bacterium]
MRNAFGILLLLSGVFCAEIARAARIVLISSQIPAQVQAETRTKRPEVQQVKETHLSPAETERRERLLKQLRDLYKQSRPEN